MSLQIVLNTPKTSLLKSSHPKKYLPNFPTPKKSFDPPRHLKFGVPPPPPALPLGLTHCIVPMLRYTLYVEMAANGMFGAGKDGLINAPDPSRKYTLSMAEVAVFDTAYYQVLMDLTVIIDLAKVCDEMLPFIKVADSYHCLKCPVSCPLIKPYSVRIHLCILVITQSVHIGMS